MRTKNLEEKMQGRFLLEQPKPLLCKCSSGAGAPEEGVFEDIQGSLSGSPTNLLMEVFQDI